MIFPMKVTLQKSKHVYSLDNIPIEGDESYRQITNKA